jgi:hypothetical protein
VLAGVRRGKDADQPGLSRRRDGDGPSSPAVSEVWGPWISPALQDPDGAFRVPEGHVNRRRKVRDTRIELVRVVQSLGPAGRDGGLGEA